MTEGGLRRRSPEGRWLLLATVLGTGLAFLDTSIVNVALPAIGRDLDAGFDALRWVANAYALTLASLLVVGGALGDRLGRRRVFIAGTVVFALASLACALAPTAGALIAARAAQGCGAALLVPGSLALLEASMHPADRAAAIGTWSGLSGVAAAIGPSLGGWLIDALSWQVAFLLNLPLAAIVVVVARRHVPESAREGASALPLDVAGALLAVVGAAGLALGLGRAAERGVDLAALAATLAGALALALLAPAERRAADPLLPPALIRGRAFAVANALTLVVWGALGVLLLLVPVGLQVVLGLGAAAAGAALAPVTVLMALFSGRSARLAERVGARPLLVAGALLVAGGMALLARLEPGDRYLRDVLPGVLVLALGLVLAVAPLTALVMASAGTGHAGIASALNNAVARIGSLLAIALIPPLAGLGDAATRDPARASPRAAAAPSSPARRSPWPAPSSRRSASRARSPRRRRQRARARTSRPTRSPRVAIATPTAATAMPTQESSGRCSPMIAQAISAASGGTRKKRAETRDASPRRIIARSRVIEMIELPITR